MFSSINQRSLLILLFGVFGHSSFSQATSFKKELVLECKNGMNIYRYSAPLYEVSGQIQVSRSNKELHDFFSERFDLPMDLKIRDDRKVFFYQNDLGFWNQKRSYKEKQNWLDYLLTSHGEIVETGEIVDISLRNGGTHFYTDAQGRNLVADQSIWFRIFDSESVRELYQVDVQLVKHQLAGPTVSDQVLLSLSGRSLEDFSLKVNFAKVPGDNTWYKLVDKKGKETHIHPDQFVNFVSYMEGERVQVQNHKKRGLLGSFRTRLERVGNFTQDIRIHKVKKNKTLIKLVTWKVDPHPKAFEKKIVGKKTIGCRNSVN